MTRAHAPNVLPAWTRYTYDALGRTLTVTLADRSVTRYQYNGNITTVTDAAGKWKRCTTDALGNLILVNEPNPGGGAEYVTSYTYDNRDHLIGVAMPRAVGSGTVTQVRGFGYSGNLLTWATNPENGTVQYGYDVTGKLATRVDAKGQWTDYSYDEYGRLTAVAHSPANHVEDATQRVEYSYDVNPPGSSYGENLMGRVAAVSWRVMDATGSPGTASDSASAIRARSTPSGFEPVRRST